MNEALVLAFFEFFVLVTFFALGLYFGQLVQKRVHKCHPDPAEYKKKTEQLLLCLKVGILLGIIGVLLMLAAMKYPNLFF